MVDLVQQALYKKDDLVQFTESHKWCGCIEIITEVKKYDDDIKYMVGVPIPEQGTAYIFSMESKKEFEYVGKSLFIFQDEDENES